MSTSIPRVLWKLEEKREEGKKEGEMEEQVVISFVVVGFSSNGVGVWKCGLLLVLGGLGLDVWC